MSYKNLDDVTGVGKFIIIRNKETRERFTVGTIEDEVSITDGENKYFIQKVQLAPGVTVEGDNTRVVFRLGYYTNRAIGGSA